MSVSCIVLCCFQFSTTLLCILLLLKTTPKLLVPQASGCYCYLFFPPFLIDDYKVKALIPLYDGGYWPGLASHRQPTILTLDVRKDWRVCIKEGQGRAGAGAVVLCAVKFYLLCCVQGWARLAGLAGPHTEIITWCSAEIHLAAPGSERGGGKLWTTFDMK